MKKLYLIRGEQLDGDHEYQIHSVVSLDKEPTNQEAFEIMVTGHVFGFEEGEEILADTNFHLYGDGMTGVKVTGWLEITQEEYELLKRLRLAY